MCELTRKRIPDPDRIRTIEGTNFAWVDRALLHTGFLSEMRQEEFALYMFLCLVADRYGVSYYGSKKIRKLLKMGYRRFQAARDALVKKGLIVFEKDPRTNQVIYQVLPLPIDKLEIETRRMGTASDGVRTIVDEFYKRAGIRVSSQKKQKGYEQGMKLLKDGFSLEDIRLAADWALSNFPEVHSFGIVVETIGQAVAEKRARTLETASRLRERERILQEQRRIELEREEDEIADALIAEMSEEERQALRQRAMEELGETLEGVRFDSARRILIEMQEREIVRRERLKKE